MSFRNVLADKGIDPGTVAFIHQESVHIFPSGRPFIQNRNLQISVHQKSQRSGNRSSRHHQQMGILSLGRQLTALGNAKPVLLIGNDQSQVLKLSCLRQQSMSANCHLDFSQTDPFPENALLLWSHGAR